jgi:hypothetical protein
MRTEINLGNIARAVVIDTRADKSVRARIRDNAPHAHYALERDDIRAELSAFQRVCVEVGPRPFWGVWEPFGGSGWHSALIQAEVAPSHHVVCDISQDCIASIEATCSRVHTRLDDSFRLLRLRALGNFDWVHADFNLWTLDRMAEDPDLRKAFHGVFAAAQRLVTFTDTTPYTLDGEHPGRWFYELRQWLQAMTGWSIVGTFEWGPAAMHMLVPEITSRHIITGPYVPMNVEILSQTE